ncbi:hypothetical protein AB0383_08725 [Amycolatopsis sp. NPDC051373]|uniref:hypothetical protein n=1 Tax=Amycolatopsis sp. NPDC051373 TaxID=3155801 RepID=UPI00344C580D
MRRRPVRATGFVVPVEGSPSADTAAHLADWLRRSRTGTVAPAADPGWGDPPLQALLSSAAVTTARARVLAAAAVRADVVEREVRPALESGAIVVIERLIDSELEQGGTGLDPEELVGLAEWLAGLLRLDFTILLDHSPDEPSPTADTWDRRIRRLLRDLSTTARCVVVETADRDGGRAQVRAAMTTALARIATAQAAEEPGPVDRDRRTGTHPGF